MGTGAVQGGRPTCCILTANQGICLCSIICPLPLRKQTLSLLNKQGGGHYNARRLFLGLLLDQNVDTVLIVHGIHLSNILTIGPAYIRCLVAAPRNAEKTDWRVANMLVQTRAADIQILLLLRRQPASVPTSQEADMGAAPHAAARGEPQMTPTLTTANAI